jgi:hypothetical protein
MGYRIREFTGGIKRSELPFHAEPQREKREQPKLF